MISGATAFCTGPYVFTVICFLLGLAEAGFYPGPVFFFTYWLSGTGTAPGSLAGSRLRCRW
jgi:ACS family tartrate transporter-like MFS transporter